MGCRSFALLFDDIEPEMCKQDKEVFQSFAHAQVALTNDVYEHLGQPNFLFCPTQYCSARAVPSVRNSEYLNTIGEKLAPDIHVKNNIQIFLKLNILLAFLGVELHIFVSRSCGPVTRSSPSTSPWRACRT